MLILIPLRLQSVLGSVLAAAVHNELLPRRVIKNNLAKTKLKQLCVLVFKAFEVCCLRTP